MAESPLPDGVPEVASIRISVGLSSEGVGSGYAIDGMSDEEALGRLISIQKAIENSLERKWDAIMDDLDEDFDDEDPDEEVLTCPHCLTLITLGDLERRDEDEGDLS